jgi:FtsP/CotA-like multicopper oxidase with cupredoxin domain
MDRRRFVGLVVGGATLALGGCLPARGDERGAGRGASAGPYLPEPALTPQDLSLVTAPLEGPTEASDVVPWAINGTYPAPTLRVRRGETATVRLDNRLPEDTILHWHGLNVPPEADGHPRLAIPPGASYDYRFTVLDRPGTYWYHPHPHGRTAVQTYRGMAGFFIVEDPEEAALGVPAGSRDLPILLQDRRLDADGDMVYAPFGPDLMFGYMGDAAFANGVADAVIEVEPAPYRLRLLNGSNARIFNLALDDSSEMVLIATDGGLLEAPQPLTEIMLATAERADVVVDFSRYSDGTELALESRAFDVPGMMGRGMMGRGMGAQAAARQGAALRLLRFVVRGSVRAGGDPPLAAAFASLPPLDLTGDTPRRVFEFGSMMMRHTINGRAFAMDRIDFEVPLGESEIWALRNPSALPHPVHVHAGQFRVLSRAGGRGRVLPWERGLKDTVLLMPGEQVEIAVRFPDYRGVYLMHCHNLEHEDAGMMMNFAVV